MHAELIRLFEREQTNDIIINYGEFVINSVQINQQIFRDLRWAALSLFLAGVMLRVGSGSWFMTFAGVFQLVVRCFQNLPLQFTHMHVSFNIDDSTPGASISSQPCCLVLDIYACHFDDGGAPSACIQSPAI